MIWTVGNTTQELSGKEGGSKAMKGSPINGKTSGLLGNESGVIFVLVIISLLVLLGFAALAIDVGHLMVVRNELQNAADATALAAANNFYPKSPTSSPTTPDWYGAEATASNTIGVNKSDGIALTECDVLTGYWDLTNPALGLKSKGITPGPMDAPAIQVTVRRASGKNGGPVQNFLAGIFGKPTNDAGAQATAVSASPGSVRPGALFPIAISKELADQAISYNSPSNTVRIGSGYHYPNSMAGQWTSFTLDSNNVPTIRDLMQYGNPDSLSRNDNIWIEPGTKTSLYSSVPTDITVLLAVVDATILDTTHSEVPIYSFIGFHITDSVGGSKKYVEGYFVFDYYAGLSGPGGPNYGVYSPPKLVK
jgi:Flp pilus assembly protein TadG